MIVVSAATSRTGSAVAEALLSSGESVRVLGRTLDRLTSYSARGAEAVTVDPEDTDSVRWAFDGAEAAFVMLAPGIIPDSLDFNRYQQRVIDAYRQALADLPELQRVVVLSGWAANYVGARGPVWGLRPLEEAIATVGWVQATHLRPGWFMENALPMVDQIRANGVARGLIPGDLALPAIATADIGTVAADLLTGKRTATNPVLELQGPADVTLYELTEVIGRIVGRTDATYDTVDAETMRNGLLSSGFSAHMAQGVVDMTIDVAERRITMLQTRNAETRTPTTFESFLSAHLQSSRSST
ncbi:NmrA family NAD(P)-binding protein [Mycolicibacterium goodii]|uniref:NmrA family NAD(P)-binding protein n=1 Tax=Mycolicibacterium goodii TaxID=134601 RepID=UPI000C264DCE|nr:NmrA family NAD(P)-binding protein [Mycolicibacterium goodii]PJK21334.1 hypothetical protein CSX11_16515 [Mycolicibacterium goodii]ULN47731.1 NmrA family NAD(P)-binding protein [Mycolicibacterium goodii]